MIEFTELAKEEMWLYTSVLMQYVYHTRYVSSKLCSFRFVCQKSIEERLVIVQEKKKAIADRVLTG